MSTRGAIGFRSNRKDYIGYNHSDSYPSWLGVRVLADCRKLAKLKPETLSRKIGQLTVIGEGQIPTAAEKKKLARWNDFSVNAGDRDDWYCILRKAQGSMYQTFKCGYIGDATSFLKDSLFCEWAYILNADNRTLEVYCGFNKNPKAKGRYAQFHDEAREKRYAELNKVPEDTYYGIRLVNTYSLDDLPTEAQFLKALEKFNS